MSAPKGRGGAHGPAASSHSATPCDHVNDTNKRDDKVFAYRAELSLTEPCKSDHKNTILDRIHNGDSKLEGVGTLNPHLFRETHAGKRPSSDVMIAESKFSANMG